MLTVVQDDLVMAASKERGDRLGQINRAAVVETQGVSHGARHIARRRNVRQFNEPDLAGGRHLDHSCRRDSQSCLADPSRPKKCHDRRGRRCIGHDFQVGVAADQTTNTLRQVALPSPCDSQWRVTPGADLKEALLTKNVIESVGAKITQLESLNQRSGQFAHQRLPTMAS